MWAREVVVDHLAGDGLSGVLQSEEQRLVHKPSRIFESKAPQIPFCIGLTRAMKCQGTPVSSLQASIAFEVTSVPWSLTMRSGLPRREISAPGSCATRRPETEVLTTAARHYFVTPSITLKTRNRQPWANWSSTKSTDQCAFDVATVRSGARVPVGFLRSRRLRTVRPSSR